MPSDPANGLMLGNNSLAGSSKGHLFGPPKPPRTAAGLLASRERYIKPQCNATQS